MPRSPAESEEGHRDPVGGVRGGLGVLVPEPELEAVTDGSQCRLSDTEEFVRIFEQVSGLELGWLFDAYLNHARLPSLNVRESGDELILTWETESAAAFVLPVPVMLGDAMITVPMDGGSGRVALDGKRVEIDPENWILKTIERF